MGLNKKSANALITVMESKGMTETLSYKKAEIYSGYLEKNVVRQHCKWITVKWSKRWTMKVFILCLKRNRTHLSSVFVSPCLLYQLSKFWGHHRKLNLDFKVSLVGDMNMNQCIHVTTIQLFKKIDVGKEEEITFRHTGQWGWVVWVCCLVP